jgi:hypothetical protein
MLHFAYKARDGDNQVPARASTYLGKCVIEKGKPMRLKILAAVAVLAAGLCGTAVAQDAPPPGQGGTRGGRGPGANFPGIGGQITAIDGSTITLQTFRGETAKVNITSSTRLTKDRNEAKLSDFKVGDRVFASGEQGKDGVWTARMLAERTGGGFRGGMMGAAQLKPGDNGKTYIAGEVIKIDGTKLTIKKPDNTEQIIEVDDDTSFRSGRESVTLAEVKIGNFVRGQGILKNGVFVPKELNAGRARGPRQGAAPLEAVPQTPSQTAPASNDQKQ